MTRANVFSVVTATATILCLTPHASAQLDDKVWVGGTGNKLWQVDANWTLLNNPTTFPNDPGRVDPDPAVITNVIGANLAVNLAANLNVDVGATDVTVAALTLGSTGNPIATNITSTGGRLAFENFESNDTTPEPDVCAFNCGAALITTGGVAGATNTISAPVFINDQVDVTGTTPITFSGGIQHTNPGVSLRALLPTTVVHITGGITTVNSEGDEEFLLNSSGISQGTIDVNSVISGTGGVQYGSQAQGGTFPRGKIILRGTNTYTGRTTLSLGTVVLANNSAFSTPDVKEEGPSGITQTGYNIESNDDARTIANTRIIGQWLTVKGANSLTWSGMAYQTNTGGWINMLPAGKTLTLSGAQIANSAAENPLPPAPGRILTFDGTGKTIVSGPLHDEWDPATQTLNPGNRIGFFAFRGSGTTYLSNTTSTYSGETIMQGQNVHFATNAALGNTSRFRSEGGAIGIDDGVVNNATFFGKLNSAANPDPDAAGNPIVYDNGGLMLASGEYAMNLDFTGAHATAANMSVAAHEAGSSCTTCGTYSGSITPANSTYRFGGGSGTLTLPGVGPAGGPYTPNQFTGTNNVFITNGGEVRITNSNNYTGTTSISAKYLPTLQNIAAVDSGPLNDGDNIPNDQIYLGTTLSVSSLADGGSPSNIGSSSSAAGNLYIQGSTLKYTGAAASTNRLFTIGSGDATIEASGTGALSFTNTGSLGVDIAEARTGTINTFAGVNGVTDGMTVREITSTEDLRIGMPIMASGIPAGATITRIVNAHELTFAPSTTFAFTLDGAVTFGPAPERKLVLTGSNTGNNSLASVIPNASDGGLVGVTKTGGGKWVLTGNSSYGGATTVSAGTLLVNGAHSGTGAVTVAAGATLGGIGSLAGAVTNNGRINAGASVGNLTLNGGLTMGADSFLDVELLGSTADKLTITGDLDLAALGQSLNVVDLGKTGTQWLIATYTGTLTGTFENVTSGYTVDYGTSTPGQVKLNFSGVVGLLGDFNNDNKVDAADYVIWRENGANPLPNDGGAANQNARYGVWKANFGNTSPGSSSTLDITAAVPEPASWLLAVLALGAVTALGRSRRP